VTAPWATGMQREGGEVAVSAGALLWCLFGGLFLVLRFAGILSVPVGGAELDGLAGAWQAHVGNSDPRFTPTFFQALVAATFELSTSEMPARALAFLASASMPFALYRLRPVLGDGGALMALLLLVFDAPGTVLGSTGSAPGFDLPIALWLFVLIQERRARAWHWAPAGFVAATSGPVWLPLALGAGIVRLFRQEYPGREALMYGMGGAAAGVALASLRFGVGWNGLVVPPFDLLANGFEREWSTESTGYLAALYFTPQILLGLAVVAHEAYAVAGGSRLDRARMDLLAWGAAAGLWLIAAIGSHDPVPLAALGLPLALVCGPAVARALSAARAADWTDARMGVPAIMAALAIAAAFALQWARAGRVGGTEEQLAVAGMAIVAVACVVWIGWERSSLPALAVPLAMVALLSAVASLSHVVFGSPQEPLTSPVSTLQAREIRDIAVEARSAQGGLIVLHPSLERALTWPFRDSGEVVVASGSVPDAVVVIWPADAPPPDGFSPLDGRWAIAEERRGPEAGVLDYLRWLANRNTLAVGRQTVNVYLKAAP